MKKLLFKSKTVLPMILQDEMAECGHACVAMISNFWGHTLDLKALRKKLPTALYGVNLREIAQLLEALSFETHALQVPLSELAFVQCPAILHWNMNHFVVLKKVKRKSFIIHDPALGIRHLSLEEMSRLFTGIVLEVKKEFHFKPLKIKENLTLSSFMRGISGLKPMLLGLLCLSFFIEFLNLLSPMMMQYVTDHVLGSNQKENLFTLMGGFAALMLLLIFITHQRSHAVLYLKMHLTEKITHAVIRHLFKLPLSFFETRHKGDLHSKINAIGEIQQKIGTDFINVLLDSMMILLHLTVMLFYSPLLSSVVIGILSMYSMLRLCSYRTLQFNRATSIYQHAKTASVFLESLQAIVPLKTFLKEHLRLNAWRNHFIEALNHDIADERIQIRFRSIYQLLNQVEYLTVIGLGTMLIMKHQFSLGMLFAFLAFRQQLVGKWDSFMHHLSEYRLISIQLNRLNDILSETPEDLIDKPTAHPLLGTLQFQEVAFRYNATLPYLFNNLNLTVQAGEKIAIIGPSGCGKSTLLKLMMGLLVPTTGKILIDGLPLHDFGIKPYRLSIASVMQEDTLLSGSILDNITFFAEDVDHNFVRHVANIACIDQVIDQLPMGYETLIGDMGSVLSGGQKQRILLARALYKKPKIIFLDEATSHLDAENESQINQALQSLKITQIVVAHRQETIRAAHRVIDLSKM